MSTQLSHDTTSDSEWAGNGVSTTLRPRTNTVTRRHDEHGNPKRHPGATAMGWFSIGLGLAEALAPRTFQRFIGIEDPEENVGLVRSAYGGRELVAGAALLTRPEPTYWMWNRVIGDLVDLGSLGRAMRNEKNDRGRLAAAAIAVAACTVVDAMIAMQMTSEKSPAAGHDPGSFALGDDQQGTVKLRATVTINRPIEEVYEYFRNLENLPQVISHLDAVRVTSETRSHWKAKAPAGMTVEWDAEIDEERDNEFLSWHSLEREDVDNTGSLRFTRASGDRGTEVHAVMEYHPRGGVVGAKLASLFRGIPQTELQRDLRRVKQLIETGEVVLSDAIVGKTTPHPSRPSESNR
jgi:uncharacterized membrane protein